MKSSISVDVEKDLHTGKYLGVTKGLPRLLDIFDRHKIKASFFVTGNVLKRYPGIIKLLADKGHEVGLHGYSHVRFDSIGISKKENEIKRSIGEYLRIFGELPKGFRCPQHSVDRQTLKLLEKYGIRYDSSLCSRNIMLLRHLVKRKSNKIEIIKNFLGKTKPHRVSKKLTEIPRASPILALGGFELKIYPKWVIRSIVKLHKLFGIPLNFVMHSWDMIDIKKSKTSRYCSSKNFEKRLGNLIDEIKKRCHFVKMEELIEC